MISPIRTFAILLLVAGAAKAAPIDCSSTKISTTGSGTQASPWRGWDVKLNAIAKTGPVVAYFPQGFYRLSQPLNLPRGSSIKGDGMELSWIVTTPTYTSAGIQALCPLNEQHQGHQRIENLTIWCPNPDNDQAGIEIRGFSHIRMINARTLGWRYGCVLDQAMMCKLDNFHAELWYPKNRVGLWLVNGPGRIAGAIDGSTNVIDVVDGNFKSVHPGQVCIADDGGYNHIIRGNNFGGTGTAVAIAGTKALTLSGNYFENFKGPSVTLSNMSFNEPRYNVNQPAATLIEGNGFWVKAPSIQCISAGTVTLISNAFAGPGEPHVIGTGNVGGAKVAEGNLCVPGAKMADGEWSGVNSE